MTSSPAPDLDELERLAEAASKPPWEWAQDDYTGKWVFTGSHGSFEVDTTADAAYIVALVNAAPDLLAELRAAREATAPTPLAPPAGISPVETAGHSAPDLEPRTEAGRRLFTDNEPMDMLESDGVTWADVLAIEAEAAADSGRLTALDLAIAMNTAQIQCAEIRLGHDLLVPATRILLALLATPPAPSDHGARERDAETVAGWFHEAYERLAPAFGYETRKASAVPWADVPEPNRTLMVAVAADVLARLATPAVPPEEPRP